MHAFQKIFLAVSFFLKKSSKRLLCYTADNEHEGGGDLYELKKFLKFFEKG